VAATPRSGLADRHHTPAYVRPSAQRKKAGGMATHPRPRVTSRFCHARNAANSVPNREEGLGRSHGLVRAKAFLKKDLTDRTFPHLSANTLPNPQHF
jgi:hypothetical protein